MIRIQSRAEFARLLEELSASVAIAEWHWRLSQQISASLESFPEVQNQAPIFWSFTIRAHQLTALHSLCRVYDYTKGALGLESWLRTIEKYLCAPYKAKSPSVSLSLILFSNAAIDPKQLESDIASCNARDLMVSRLIILRNKMLAHRDANHTLGLAPIQDHEQLTFAEIKPLIDRALKILNRYSIILFGHPQGRRLDGADDFQAVIGSVDAYLNQRRD